METDRRIGFDGQTLRGAAMEVSVMALLNINRQNMIVVRMLRVRRHFASCKKCRAARSTRDFTGLCQDIQMELVEVAVQWDSNIAGRLAARQSTQPTAFLCPAPNAHGPAYAAMAEPVIIGGTQGSIF